jgi:nicotinate-nucleotide adenylyltransferase
MNGLEQYSGEWRGRKVGILGGSFNPAHDGHLHISREALDRLKLDAVWWMISPQNPLKSEAGMAPFEERLNSAREITRDHPQIVPVTIEQQINTRYTSETLRILCEALPDTKFVWLMGADNLLQIHKWENWRSIFETLPIAVMDRPPAGQSETPCPASEQFAKMKMPENRAPDLAETRPPCWTILHIPLHPLSATEIRARREMESEKNT